LERNNLAQGGNPGISIHPQWKKPRRGDTPTQNVIYQTYVPPCQGLNVDLFTLPKGSATLHPGLCCSDRTGLFSQPLKWVSLFSGIGGSAARGLKHHAWLSITHRNGLSSCLKPSPFIPKHSKKTSMAHPIEVNRISNPWFSGESKLSYPRRSSHPR